MTAPAGFEAVGLACSIKPGMQPDLSLIVATPGTVGAAMFTINRAAAAPVALSRRHLAVTRAVRAVVLNSGCANAGTGAAGAAAARATVSAMAAAVGCNVDQVLVCSTGAIGPALDTRAILSGITVGVPRLSDSARAGTDAAIAIMTTDTVPKETRVDGPGFVVGGMAKGAGMVRPDLATMLVVLTTDAVAAPDLLDEVLSAAVDRSFHELNIDGCASTNDTVILLASGQSGVAADPGALGAAVAAAGRDLAEQLVADAEGATRVVTIEVSGAVDDAAARRAGRGVADSALVGSSLYGGDPNWGRLLGALGATDVAFDPGEFSVAYQGTVVATGGIAADFDEADLLARMETGDVTIRMTIGTGPGEARVLTTELSPEYVIFNGERS